MSRVNRRLTHSQREILALGEASGNMLGIGVAFYPMLTAPMHSAGLHRFSPAGRRKDGIMFWAAIFISPVRDEGGEVVQHFASFVDLTKQKQEQAQSTMMINELNHRVKNTLATVQSIVWQFRSQGDPRIHRVSPVLGGCGAARLGERGHGAVRGSERSCTSDVAVCCSSVSVRSAVRSVRSVVR